MNIQNVPSATKRIPKNRPNMKETWKILNGLINKKSKGKQISTEFNGDSSMYAWEV